ncbi:hypothetical protein E5676_scaffold1428G001010 [Cucumis melo var. makuwa]|uniref:Uncharacterized protein n=1 Tax=Cucumis melo var. makuwa TaxID=1194695 RepID=A0A5D3DFK9_CUCMM|nr:hypothetical protein E5676_scaffold1428G001010 [Cucumis melo var. makuwa]
MKDEQTVRCGWRRNFNIVDAPSSGSHLLPPAIASSQNSLLPKTNTHSDASPVSYRNLGRYGHPHSPSASRFTVADRCFFAVVVRLTVSSTSVLRHSFPSFYVR